MREGWEYKKLGDIFAIAAGGTPSRNKKEYWNGDIPWVKIKDIRGKYVNYVEEYITEQGLKNSSAKMFCKGTLLYTIFATLGEVAILNIDATTNQAIAGLKLNDNAVVLEFAYYYLQSLKQNVLNIGKGVAQKNINLTILRNLDIPVPLKSVQLTIVAELDQINDLIRLKKEQLKEYDNLAQSIFYDMFGDPVENEKGWDVKKLKEVCLSITDGDHMPPPKSDSGIPFLTISDIDKETRTLNFGDTFYVPQEYYDKLKDDRKAMMGDLLYTVTGSYGIPVEVKTEQPFCFQRHIALIKVNKENILTKFLCHWVLCKSVKFMADRVATGIAQKTVGLNSLRNFDVILPPLPLQQEFSSRIEQIEKLKTEVQKTITDLETLLASRMQYWFE